MFSVGILLICWLHVYKNTVREKYAFPDNLQKTRPWQMHILKYPCS